MKLVRYEPMRGLLGFNQGVGRVLDELLPTVAGHEGIFSGALMPPVDIYETEKEVVAKAELPGYDSKDVDIRVEDGVLILRGESKKDGEIKDEHYHRVERSYGKFERSFRLPKTVDVEKIKANYKDGILEIAMPKKKESQPKEVKINIG